MPRIVPLLAAAILLLTPGAAGLPPPLAPPTPSHAPLAVAVATWNATHDAVAWAPGVDPADAHRVYGVAGGAFVLLAEVLASDAVGAVVEGGYAAYAVAGVKGGAESEAVAASGVGAACVRVHPEADPPYVAVCKPIGAAVMVPPALG